MKKNVFICYSGEDRESVNEFKGILHASIKSAKLSDKISVFDMNDFENGKSILEENEKFIKDVDIYIVMLSPNFFNSKYDMNNVIPAIMDYVNEGTKHAFYIILEKSDELYTDHPFIKGKVCFSSTKASSLDYFNKDMGSQTISLKSLFVEELVDKMKKFVEVKNDNLIRDIKDLPHLDDFMKGKRRALRTCKEKDKLIFADYLMRIQYPPMRHLLVVNDAGDLAGIISIRDVLAYGVRNKTKKIGNLSIIEEEAKNEQVSEHCKLINDMEYLMLDEENKIEDVIQKFIRSTKTGKSIGAIPVIRKKGVFTEGDFEIVSYIDILKSWEKLPVGSDLKNMGVENFSSQDHIEVVHDDDEISVPYQSLLEGKRSIPVVDIVNKYAGIIADTELLGGIGNNNLGEKTITMLEKKAKNLAKVQINCNANFGSIVDHFIKNREYTSLPVLDNDGKIIKMIGHTDVLRKIRDSIVNNNKSE